MKELPKQMRWAVHVALIEMRNTYKIVVRRPQGKTPRVGYSRIWEDVLKWIIGKWVGRMWIHLAQVRDW
jgi:hypothetical protein